MSDNYGSLIEALSRLVTACELEQQGLNGAKEGVATAAALGREMLDRIVHGVSDEAPASEEDRAFVERGMARLRAGPQLCGKAPEGWRCTRLRSHDGPCAAVVMMADVTPCTLCASRDLCKQYGCAGKALERERSAITTKA